MYVACFVQLVLTGFWVTWTKNNGPYDQFLPRPARKESNVTKLKCTLSFLLYALFLFLADCTVILRYFTALPLYSLFSKIRPVTFISAVFIVGSWEYYCPSIYTVDWKQIRSETQCENHAKTHSICVWQKILMRLDSFATS